MECVLCLCFNGNMNLAPEISYILQRCHRSDLRGLRQISSLFAVVLLQIEGLFFVLLIFFSPSRIHFTKCQTRILGHFYI